MFDTTRVYSTALKFHHGTWYPRQRKYRFSDVKIRWPKRCHDRQKLKGFDRMYKQRTSDIRFNLFKYNREAYK